MRRPSVHQVEHGFSLAEILAVVAMVAILATMAAPAMNNMIEGQRAKSAAADLFTAITRARSEAIKRNTDISLTPTPSWASGWTIANPANNANAIENHNAVRNVTITGPASLTYGATGRLRNSSAPQFQITTSSGTARCITIDLSGRPNIKNTSC